MTRGLLFLALVAFAPIAWPKEDALRPVPLGEVKLTGYIGVKADNLLRERVLSDWAQNVMMKECEEAFDAKTDGDDVRGSWQGEYWGKSMLGFVRVADYTGDRALKDFIRASARRMVARQAPDGYLGTYRDPLFVTNDPARVTAKYGFPDDCNWNVWCRTFTAWGLCEAGRLTGDRTLVDAAARSFLQLIEMLRSHGISITDTGCNAGLPSCTAIRPALLLYRETGDARFLAFAREIVAKWNRSPDVPPNFFRHADSGKSVYRWYEGRPDIPWGWPKANEMTSCLSGLVEYFRATGDRQSFETAVKVEALLAKYEKNAIDSVGYNDTFHDAASIPSATTEPCDVVVWLMLAHDLYLATGDARYLDEMETTYLNAFLAGVHRDGKWGARLVRSQGRHLSAPPQAGMKHSHCCVNNLPRAFMDFAEATLARDAEGAYRLAFYTDATAALEGVRLDITGNWPVGDLAHVKVASPRPAVLKFRIPRWTSFAKVNGKDVSATDGWWTTSVKAGETVFDFAFDLRPRFVPLPAEPDLANALKPEIVRRWRPNGADLTPYYHVLNLRRLRRGPLLLAKSMNLPGAREEDVFYWGRIDHGDWSCELKAESGVTNVWGAWSARFTSARPDEKKRAFSVRVCDFQSTGDREEKKPAKTFSIFY